MSREGYAVNFNLHHQRSGHLFQNRHKSIFTYEEGVQRLRIFQEANYFFLDISMYITIMT
jgi:hypothetical protein